MALLRGEKENLSVHLKKPMGSASPLDFLVEMHGLELDRFIRQQEQRLRAAVHQQRKRSLVAILRGVQAKASALMKQKEEELAQVRKQSTELQEMVGRAEVQSREWQRMVAEQEALVLELNGRLEEAKMREGPSGSCSSSAGCCGERGRCRGCDFGVPCMLFLPCRHLSSCKLCDLRLTSCPICSAVKQTSVEIFMA